MSVSGSPRKPITKKKKKKNPKVKRRRRRNGHKNIKNNLS